MSNTTELTWFVYEGAAGSNYSFNKIFEFPTTSAGLGYHSSGTIDVALQADRFYLIGVRPAGSCERFYSVESNYEYLASGGMIYRSLYSYDSSSLDTAWSASSTSTSYPVQRLTFE